MTKNNEGGSSNWLEPAERHETQADAQLPEAKERKTVVVPSLKNGRLTGPFRFKFKPELTFTGEVVDDEGEK